MYELVMTPHDPDLGEEEVQERTQSKHELPAQYPEISPRHSLEG
jgi:hypothetical protein